MKIKEFFESDEKDINFKKKLTTDEIKTLSDNGIKIEDRLYNLNELDKISLKLVKKSIEIPLNKKEEKILNKIEIIKEKRELSKYITQILATLLMIIVIYVIYEIIIAITW